MSFASGRRALNCRQAPHVTAGYDAIGRGSAISQQAGPPARQQWLPRAAGAFSYFIQTADMPWDSVRLNDGERLSRNNDRQ